MAPCAQSTTQDTGSSEWVARPRNFPYEPAILIPSTAYYKKNRTTLTSQGLLDGETIEARDTTQGINYSPFVIHEPHATAAVNL